MVETWTKIYVSICVKLVISIPNYLQVIIKRDRDQQDIVCLFHIDFIIFISCVLIRFGVNIFTWFLLL